MTPPDRQIASTRPISIAILAMGGEGGGVLAEWIVDLAEHGTYLAQATSVPGVAQRTGATIYYVELFPRADAKAAKREPVFALMPTPGDVDAVIASEFMEAGRAVQRGLVTPDKTTLIASTHRVYAMAEKTAIADGRADSAALDSSCRTAAKRFIGFDMAALAEATDSVISAVLFGALAASGVLPFQRTAFEAAIRRCGVGMPQSLAAFAVGFEGVRGQGAEALDHAGEPDLPPDLQALLAPVVASIPIESLEVIRAGLARLADYQDIGYAREFIEHLRPFMRSDLGPLLTETARQLALAMTYEDTIRVAELKTRASRFDRVRREAEVKDAQLLEVAEFMHPRTQEIADTLPAGVGRWLLHSSWARPLMDRMTRSGRVVRTTSIGGFLLLRTIAMLKPFRRRSLRFVREQQGVREWLHILGRTAADDPALAVEIAQARGLVKGYGETYERGLAKFETLMRQVPAVRQLSQSAAAFTSLRWAALKDEDGLALRSAIEMLSAAPPRIEREGPADGMAASARAAG
jgi:indolepyruvate ferredoxin oxidoreductase beta subunit